MAFNFNWSPLIADTERARDMLTTALNKSPKPPIIVDDILVTELNLGSTPPSLEILEIGDLAEDRFRGIFKMVYSGDAFLTLKTRVQANPLNTYLSTKPGFASPQPLAAASGLTIPLAITLSDIKLSGFVILVFSRQKGITLVFRNDPLESLKVSSTFDSIPFVRDYLQSEIEKQLRVLFLEDLPAIIHRLSLRLLVPSDHLHTSSADLNSNSRLESPHTAHQDQPIDPLASPLQVPAGAEQDNLDTSFISLDDSSAHYSFSRKNLLRLAALNDSHRTLSLFTPPIRDTVVRAWAGAAEHNRDLHTGPFRGVGSRPSSLTLASLRGVTASANTSTPETPASGPDSTHSYSSDSHDHTLSSPRPSRPSITHSYSAHTYSTSGTITSASGRPRARKRKHRVVNLRRTTNPPAADAAGSVGDVTSSSRPSTPTSTAPPASSSWATVSSREDDELVTPPDSPEKKTEATPQARRVPPADDLSATVRPRNATAALHHSLGAPTQPLGFVLEKGIPVKKTLVSPTVAEGGVEKPPLPEQIPLATTDAQNASMRKRAASPPLFMNGPGISGGILEQAWLMKMASEIEARAEGARRRPEGLRLSEEFGARGKWSDRERIEGGEEDEEAEPPPAYVA